MKRFIIALAFAGLFILLPFSIWNPLLDLRAQSTDQYSLQVASLPTKISAQKEIDRLKSYKVKAQILPWEDSTNKTWFVVCLMGFQSKEEATRQGTQLIQNGVIRTFRVSRQKAKEEAPVKSEKPPLPPPQPIKKESIPFTGNSPVYVGPIFSEETKEEKPVVVKELPQTPSITFRLQIASCFTLAAAQKEIDRLKTFHLKADYAVRQTQTQTPKKVFIIYLDRFKNQEEAAQKGKQLVQKKIIKNFKIFTEKILGEPPTPKVKEAPPPPVTAVKKKPAPAPIPTQGKTSGYFGPISIKEEEGSIRINITLDRKIFPEITADKITEGSRLIVTFKNIDRLIVPIQFERIQSNALLSLGLTQKGSDCTFIILLSSTFNYEVAQDYYEKEKIYSLVIGKEPVPNQPPVAKE